MKSNYPRTTNELFLYIYITIIVVELSYKKSKLLFVV